MVYLSGSKNRIMKKILLIVAMVACSYGLKAQTLVKPLDSLLLRAPNFYKNVNPDDTPFKKYFSVPPLQNNKSLSALTKGSTELFASRMPVAKVHSDDHMPIAKVGSDDHMPTLMVKPFDPLKPVGMVKPAP
jgi:hypothetical protein